MTNIEPAVWDVRTAAKYLRLGRNAVYAGIARGEIPCRRVGRRVLISRAALDAWLTSKSTTN